MKIIFKNTTTFFLTVCVVFCILVFVDSKVKAETEVGAGSGTITRLPAMKNDGIYVIPRVSGNILGSSTVDFISKTATTTTLCFSDSTCQTTAGGSGSQTPWTANIDGAGYDLTNAGEITATNIRATSTDINYFLGNTGIGTTSPFTTLSIEGRTALDDILFNTDFTPADEPAGLIWWNDDDKTVNISTGEGPVWQVNQEDVIPVYNNTGSTISDGTAVHPVGSATDGRQNVEEANSLNHVGISRRVWITTQDILANSKGFVTTFGKVRDVDTSMFSVGDKLFLATSTAAGLFNNLTNVRPEFPNYSIPIGGVLVSDNTIGQMFVAPRGEAIDTTSNFWNGTIREQFNFRVSSDGTTITGSLEPSNGHDDLTLIFSDGFSLLSVNPATTTTLTAGTDDNPQFNYVYIPKSTKALTVSTTAFPDEEYVYIAKLFLQSASATADYDALRNQNINNEIQTTADNIGFLQTIAETVRYGIGAKWRSGTEGSIEINTTPSPDDVWVSSTAGVVRQMHNQTFEAMATGTNMFIVNNFAAGYATTTNLNTELLDSTGASLENTSYSVVVWGAANKTGEGSHLMVNLPNCSYNKNFPQQAVDDVNACSVYTIPTDFQGVGFLIGRYTLVLTGTTAWTLFNSEDLRGKIPNTTAGGGGGGAGVTTFLGLTDTPSAYTGEAGKVPRVASGETALEFSSFINADGTIPLTANWATGAFTISGTGLLDFTNSSSTQATINTLFDNDGDIGTSGQVLGSTGSVTNWVDKQDTITVSYPITLTGADIGLAFGTTTANTWSDLQTFDGGIELDGNILFSQDDTWQIGSNTNQVSTLYVGAIDSNLSQIDVYDTWRLNATLDITTGSNQDLQITPNGTGNVGIASSSPYAKLSVTNTSAIPSFIVEDSASPDATPFVVSASGLVGMGVLTPASTLHLLSASPRLRISDTDTNTTSATGVIDFYAGTSTARIGMVGFTSTGDGNMEIRNQVNANLEFFTNNLQRMTIDENGNVGIGDTDPDANLEVVNDFMVSSAAGNDGDLFTVLSGGNVGIGTTTPFSLLSMSKDGGITATAPTITIENTHTSILTDNDYGKIQFISRDISAGGDGITGFIKSVAVNAGVTSALTFGTRAGGIDNAVERMRIDELGNLGIATTTPSRPLDIAGGAYSEECNLTDGATITFDMESCNQGRVVLGGNRIIDFTNQSTGLGQSIRFIACQDGTGSRTLTWDANVRWAGGTAPTLTTTADKCDVLAGFVTGATTTPVILLDKVLDF